MSANNFIIFFNQKEGTSPLIRLLDQFDELSIVHQVNGLGWEPFDVHNCGRISFDTLEYFFDLIYGKKNIDMGRLNSAYNKKGKRPLEYIDPAKVIAFKMRFRPPKYGSDLVGKLPLIRRIVNPIIKNKQMSVFKKPMFDLLRQYQIITFIAVRQDVFRWALSTYHGDGAGKEGNLQFKVADGTVKKNEIKKIYVSCDRLEKIILKCEKALRKKKELMTDLEYENIPVFPLFYESFCQDKVMYFEELFERINLSVSRDKIKESLMKGSYFKKVHSNDISHFVVNHEEVLDRFGNRFVDWNTL